MAVISMHGVSKRFSKTVALDDLDLTVEAGQIHGFLGPNGAGKSTTLRILLGMVRADSGSMSVLGQDPWSEAVELHRRLAYVPGDVALWPNLTGGETIDLLGRLHGGLDEQRLSELLDRFELDPTRKGRAYSKGNRQKVVLVTALASNAELLLLDEPTSGLDPLMEEVFRDCLEAERDRGRTVLFSSHLLAEVERLCDHVTIIRAGRAVESGAMEDLRHLAATTIRAEFREEPREPYSLGAAYDVVVDGRTLSCRVDPDGYDELLARLANMGVRRLQANPPTLEEIFLGFYSGPTPDVT